MLTTYSQALSFSCMNVESGSGDGRVSWHQLLSPLPPPLKAHRQTFDRIIRRFGLYQIIREIKQANPGKELPWSVLGSGAQHGPAAASNHTILRF